MHTGACGPEPSSQCRLETQQQQRRVLARSLAGTPGRDTRLQLAGRRTCAEALAPACAGPSPSAGHVARAGGPGDGFPLGCAAEPAGWACPAGQNGRFSAQNRETARSQPVQVRFEAEITGSRPVLMPVHGKLSHRPTEVGCGQVAQGEWLEET